MKILSRLKVGQACLAMSAVVMAVTVGGIGLSSASADVTDQTITFTSTAPTSAAVGGTAYTVTATASSGLAVALTIDPTASSVCSIAAGKVTFKGAGTCTIDANQAGNATYGPAPQVQQAFSVGQGAQTITFSSTVPAPQFAGGPSYLVTATSASGLPITISIASASSSVCLLTGLPVTSAPGSAASTNTSVVNFIGAGTCTIVASNPGNANIKAATASQAVTVSIGVQTVLFNSIAPSGGKAAKVGGSYGVRASSGSGVTAAVITVAPSSATVCSLSGGIGYGGLGGLATGTVKFIGAGTCSLMASAPATNTFLAAVPVVQSFVVEKNKAKSLTVSGKKQKAKLAVSGKLTLPAGVTAAQGYSGTVTITATKGKKTLAKTTTKLSNSGKYSATLGKGGAATSVSVKFSGNSALTSTSAKTSL
jgi:large repetitive protein